MLHWSRSCLSIPRSSIIFVNVIELFFGNLISAAPRVTNHHMEAQHHVTGEPVFAHLCAAIIIFNLIIRPWVSFPEVGLTIRGTGGRFSISFVTVKTFKLCLNCLTSVFLRTVLRRNFPSYLFSVCWLFKGFIEYGCHFTNNKRMYSINLCARFIDTARVFWMHWIRGTSGPVKASSVQLQR